MLREDDKGVLHSRHPEVMMKKFRKCFDDVWHLAARMEATTDTPMCVHTWIEGEEINIGVFRVYTDRHYAELAQKEEEGSSDFMLDISQLQHITD